MANDYEKTVSIILAGKDDLSKVVRGAEKSLSGLSDLADPLSDVGKSIVAITAALGGVAVAAADLRAGWQSSMGQIEAITGATADRADELGEIAKRVFQDDFGESIGDVVNKVTLVEQKFKDFDLNADEIQSLVSKAFALQDIEAFETDAAESLKTVKTLIENFGITETEAFDFIAKGFQDGLNSAGDFYESVGEFSTQFSTAGATADQFFSVLQSGMQEGVLGTDKAADALKEYRLRMADWKDEASAASKALKEINLDGEELIKLPPIESFQVVIDALAKVTDEADKTRIGAALIGTQFEDLAGQADSIDIAAVKMNDLAGATDNLFKQYENLGSAFSSLWRTITTELADSDQFDALENQIGETVKGIQKAWPEAFDGVDFGGLISEVSDLGSKIKGVFGDIDLTDAEQLRDVIQETTDFITGIVDTAGGIAEAFGPAVEAAGKAVEYFNSLDESTKETAGNILGIAIQVAPLAAGLLAAKTAAGGIGEVFGGIKTSVSGASGAVGGLSGAVSKLNIAAVAVGAAFAGWKIGEIMNEYIPYLKDGIQLQLQLADSITGFSEWDITDDIYNALTGTKNLPPVKIQVEADTDPAEKSIKEVTEEPATVTIVPGLDVAAVRAAGEDLAGYVEGQKFEVPIEVRKAEEAAIKATLDDIHTDYVTYWDKKAGDFKTIEIETTIDRPSVEKTKAELLAELPLEKRIEIQTELDVARINADSKALEAALNYKASVDVAEIEAAAQTVEALADTISAAFASSGEIIMDSLGLFAGLSADTSAGASQTRSLIEDQLKRENEIRKKQLLIQEELTDAQIKYLTEKSASLRRGEALIRIDGTTLEPALQMMLRSFIDHAAVYATDEGLNMLTGLQ